MKLYQFWMIDGLIFIVIIIMREKVPPEQKPWVWAFGIWFHCILLAIDIMITAIKDNK